MKTINKNKSTFPKPFRFAIYLITVIIAGFMNWVVTYANETEREEITSIEIRLREALTPVSDPEPELENWILALSQNIISDNQEANPSLESRLAKALEPVDDPAPELEDWLLNFSDEIVTGTGR